MGVFSTGFGFLNNGLGVAFVGIEVSVIFKAREVFLARVTPAGHLKFIARRNPCIPTASTPAVSICFIGVAQLLPGVIFVGHLQF